MSSAPRIVRAVPRGEVTRADAPIAVLVTLHWSTGQVTPVVAAAVAWTREAVEISWTPPGGELRTDWVPARDVRRLSASGTATSGDPDPPRSVTRRRPRW